MKKLKIHLEDGFKEVNPGNISKVMKKMREEEDNYWKEDELEDESFSLPNEENFALFV